ncbi:hypothetical protein Q4488_02245 [Amphritea sp. 1_MG-2023]|uniref:hypothetical protein n=1 Tax=Amphritea sp. 1_MG-2023 TaxID=3062670 RepID=UPI0026E20F20|nr:hypothetical protein [Amphritea sp. 1_MG-2023]MDO6562192.1 hypothetical protein [Amphritea sp. 1_MG-2023]
MRNQIITLWVASALLLAPLSVQAKKPEWAGNGAEQSAADNQQRYKESEQPSHRFDDNEQHHIRQYYLGDDYVHETEGKGKHKPKPLPPGLQKKLANGGKLPPGWQKKVIAGGVLDHDLYRRSEALPYELERRLDRIAGEEHRRIGHKIIRVLEGNATIIDVIDILDGTGLLE